MDGAAYLLDDERFESGDLRFAQAVARSYGKRSRPRCLCMDEGIEMYVARLYDGFVVKRMPDTGSRHAPDCPHYEPPADSSGLGQLLGTAIREDPATGETTLRLDFPMCKLGGRSTVAAQGEAHDSATTDGTRLSLRGLLHYLWDQAELTHWKPAFAGKRSWATVRKLLLRAAEHMIARGDALSSRLYVPETFLLEQRDAIGARRAAHWARALPTLGKPQRLLLLIGEIKEIAPARYGHKVLVKHLPDQAFAIDEQLYRRLGRHFDAELSLWGARDDLHMVSIGTFGVSEAGLPHIHELSLMPTTAEWLPVEDAFERQLVELLVRDGRSFVKGLRYCLPRGLAIVNATLVDTGSTPVSAMVTHRTGSMSARGCEHPPTCDGAFWVWNASEGPMPPLPAGGRTPLARSPQRQTVPRCAARLAGALPK